MSKTPPNLLAGTLKAEIRRSLLPVSKISELSGIPEGTLSKFLSGKDIRLSTAEKLARHFGLRLLHKKG